MSIWKTGLAIVVVSGAMTIAPAIARDQGLISEFSSQERPRPRIRVQPQQPPAWDFPRPDDYSWPAPAPAYRQCEAWYLTEYRPSGTVVTPQKRCRWVRG
jgi:hypothetical protein